MFQLEIEVFITAAACRLFCFCCISLLVHCSDGPPKAVVLVTGVKFTFIENCRCNKHLSSHVSCWHKNTKSNDNIDSKNELGIDLNGLALIMRGQAEIVQKSQ